MNKRKNINRIPSIRLALIFFALFIMVFTLIISGCAKKSVKLGEEKGAQIVVANGVGKAKKFALARDEAIRDALKKVVVGIIGE
ncbi:MAG TPA: hypothetical protein ENL19_03040, partial [candidate division WOR-3 bacterium]|nr:hypothetical protein [candidate division WOR-3 bacterium]